MKRTAFILLVIVTIATCKNAKEIESKTNPEESPANEAMEIAGEWEYLFDGTSIEGWRGYNSDELPTNWVIEDGTLKTLGLGGDRVGDIVYANEEFGEFELSLEWKMPEEGNSGIFYHIVEDVKYATAYMTAPEYQISTKTGQTGNEMQSVGADYGMYSTKYKSDAADLAGKWNTSRIRFTDEKVTYWLNGEKTVEFVPWSEDWKLRKKEGKWKDYVDYGKAKVGLIGLQDHGSIAWFKNIRIRKLQSK